ncbi:MAG: YidB family protein [Nitrospira sp.]|nr:YidB family protein [Nitrospira sp.]
MDQLGQAVGGMLGGSSNQNPLMQALTGLLGQNGSVGGLAGLVQTLQKNGLGEIVNSWVGTGKNLPVTPQQIQQGLGGDLLKQLATKAGISTEAAGTQLAGLLPDLVDKLTPTGKIEAGGLDQLLKMFQGK